MRPNGALRVHRVVDHRHHPEKGVDHPGIFLVLDRHGGAAQRLGVTLAIIVQDVAFQYDHDRRCHPPEIRRLDRRGAPVFRILWEFRR